MSNWQLPEVFISQYRAACKLAAISDKAFAVFRQDPHIACVIENTNKEWADKALEKMGYTPTMVRYWYTTHLLESLIGFWDRLEIVEIGGGYGGMCKVIQDRFKPMSYTIYDLPEVHELQNRYLKESGVQLMPHLYSINDTPPRQPDLCISWCAWSELSKPLREEYAEKVISKCDHFFICSNYNKAEDLEILSKYFTGIKEYEDELVQNVIYA